MDNVGFILKSLDFAARKHKNQFRKGEDKPPYINHPIQVASLLSNEAGEKDTILIVAAILHDVIEDTVTGEGEKQELIIQISHLFGKEVLNLILEVTDDNSLPKAERKRLQIMHAPNISDRAKKLKIADKILNIQDITSYPPVGWPLERIIEYFEWSEKVVSGLRGVNKKLEDIFDEALKNGIAKYRTSGDK